MNTTNVMMPAEWAPHDATWLAWPHQRADWPGKFEPIPHVYSEIARVLSEVERVNILVKTPAMKTAVRGLLKKAGCNLANVQLHIVPTDRSWIRDYGPMFVHDGGRVTAADWVFNGWAKYKNHKNDDAVPKRISRALKKQGIETQVIHFQADDGENVGVVLEGGAIDVNGEGCLLTTEECLLSKKVQVRNPGMSREDIEQVLAEALGAVKVLWLGNGIVGDDTHGHVDDLARFVNANTIVCCAEPDPKDENFALLAENLERLRGFRDTRGGKFNIVPLPMPEPVVYEGQRLPASYANFYIANDTVLVPLFNDEADRLALGTLAELMPGRRVVGIGCRDLVWGLGTLHCGTCQQPAKRKG